MIFNGVSSSRGQTGDHLTNMSSTEVLTTSFTFCFPQTEAEQNEWVGGLGAGGASSVLHDLSGGLPLLPDRPAGIPHLPHDEAEGLPLPDRRHGGRGGGGEAGSRCRRWPEKCCLCQFNWVKSIFSKSRSNLHCGVNRKTVGKLTNICSLLVWR